MSSAGSGMFAVEDVETYFAKSPLFRARGGDVDEATARNRIFYVESELPADQAKGATLASRRPYVILAPERLNYQPGGVADDTILLADGGVLAIVVDNPRTPANYKESFRDYWNWVTTVTDEIAGLHRTDDHCRFSITLAVIPWRPALTERGVNNEGDDFWECVLVFSYGANQ